MLGLVAASPEWQAGDLASGRPAGQRRRALALHVSEHGRGADLVVVRPDPGRLLRARHPGPGPDRRSEEHTSELQSQSNLVCRLLLEKKKKKRYLHPITSKKKKKKKK